MLWKINRTFFLVLLTTHIKGLHSTTVPDPCPNDLPSTTVAEMCTESSAVEDDKELNDNVNNVVMRMRTQKKCSCLVFFEQQSNMRQIRVKRYNDLTASVPEKIPCGLAMDISVLNQTYQEILQPWNCFDGSQLSHFHLLPNAGLQFTSRVTEGLFERGYCVQILKDPISGIFRLKLKCSDVMSTEVSDTTLSGLISTGVSDTPQNTLYSGVVQTDSELNTHIAVGVCSGVVAVVLIIVIVLVIRRKYICKPKTDKKDNSQHYSAEQNIEDNVEYDGVRDNILYVPSNEHDLYDGNYSTVNENSRKFTNKVDDTDVNYSTTDINVPDNSSKNTSGKNVPNGKQKPTIQPKPKTPKPISDNASLDISENDITHIRPPTGSGDVYAVVGKRKTTLQSDTENDGDVCCPDQTYSVVNKAQK